MYVYEPNWNMESECWWPFEPPTEDAFEFKSEEKAGGVAGGVAVEGYI